MRYIMDISPDTVDKINMLILKGGYRNVQEFIVTAIQNQIYLIEQPDEAVIQSEATRSSTLKIKKEAEAHSVSLLQLRDFNIDTSNVSINEANKTLSGFWNKFLPVKITLRVLANMQHDEQKAVLLDMLKEEASVEARKLGQTLVLKERGSGRKRGDRLFTGLPIKRRSDKSRSRFKSHFVGSLSRDKIDGMPGTLGLMSVFKGDDGRDYVSITSSGLEFSSLHNSVIDNEDYSSTLSEEEKQFLVSEIRTHLPAEYEAIKIVLNLIDIGNVDTKLLSGELTTLFPDLSENKLTIFLSGRLNRLVDLGLATRVFNGLSYKYAVSEKGNILINEDGGDEDSSKW